MEVPGDRVEDVLKFVSEEEGLGVSGIVLWPRAVSMKGCLEVCTELSHLGSERELPQASHSMVVRTWSGDTLFPVVGLGVCRCTLMVLDDLDPDRCSVLKSLISWT